MKKKGLIISTVVMVVVLIASLTTATYAWFTVSSTTTVDGFNLEVVSSNILNIGLKANTTYEDDASASSFVSGNCTYAGTAGSLTGTWTGDSGLAATVSHNIIYSNVSKAVGVTTAANVTDATIANTTAFPNSAPMPENATIIAAQKGESAGALTQQTAAVANGTKSNGADITADISADFAYLFLGASPTAEIETGTNKLYIVIQTTGNGTTIGISAGMHVAYRLNGAENWTDVDVFGETAYTATRTSTTCEVPFNIAGTGTGNVTAGDISGNYNDTTNKTSLTGAAVTAIELSDGLAIGAIDQIELVIYLAGSDTNCIDAAKGVKVNVGIFFGAQAKA